MLLSIIVVLICVVIAAWVVYMLTIRPAFKSALYALIGFSAILILLHLRGLI